MITLHHTKEKLAKAIAKNLSNRCNEFVYVCITGIKSVPSMKYMDTTVIQVTRHSELATSGLVKFGYFKGKQRTIE